MRNIFYKGKQYKSYADMARKIGISEAYAKKRYLEWIEETKYDNHVECQKDECGFFRMVYRKDNER